MANLWQRGNVWWFRMRCPKRFLPIHQQSHFNQSLKTDSKAEAEALAPLVKKRVLLDWEARLAGTASGDDRTTYQRTLALAKAGNSNLMTMDALAGETLVNCSDAFAT
ncbi:MAG: DUF6538 domain-containing protein [Cognatishimia sp.]